jgi:hypothetical protein
MTGHTIIIEGHNGRAGCIVFEMPRTDGIIDYKAVATFGSLAYDAEAYVWTSTGDLLTVTREWRAHVERRTPLTAFIGDVVSHMLGKGIFSRPTYRREVVTDTQRKRALCNWCCEHYERARQSVHASGVPGEYCSAGCFEAASEELAREAAADAADGGA